MPECTQVFNGHGKEILALCLVMYTEKDGLCLFVPYSKSLNNK